MVKCGDCGFLTVENQSTGEVLVATNMCREHGTQIHNGVNLAESCFCYKSAAAFPGRSFEKAEIAANLNQENGCQQWVKGLPGISAREHQEMLDKKEIQSAQEKRENEVWAREDRRDRDARRHALIAASIHVVEIIAVVVFGYLAINAQFKTTKMQIEAEAARDATANAARNQ